MGASYFLVRAYDQKGNISRGLRMGLTPETVIAIVQGDVDRIAKLAKSSLRSAAPKRTRELRGNVEIVDLARGLNAATSVEINDEIHETSLTKNKLTNAGLAEELDKGFHHTGTPYTRNADSINEHAFEKHLRGELTQGWIHDAQAALLSRLESGG